MIWLATYAAGSCLAAGISLYALRCDGDHNTHTCPTRAERIVGTLVLAIGWPIVIPAFAISKLRRRR